MQHVTTAFSFATRRLVAVNDVSLEIDEREIVGIVGESGCGKSLTAFSILGIVPHPGGWNPELLFRGRICCG